MVKEMYLIDVKFGRALFLITNLTLVFPSQSPLRYLFFLSSSPDAQIVATIPKPSSICASNILNNVRYSHRAVFPLRYRSYDLLST